VPNLENFDLFFYVDKSYLGGQLRDWKYFLLVLKIEADIRHFICLAHAECALKNVYTC
jgi:hypothetical protein